MSNTYLTTDELSQRDHGEILAREPWVKGKLGPTKTEGSFRSIYMPESVYQVLKSRQKVTVQSEGEQQ